MKKILITLLISGLFAGITGLTFAALPQSISYQGYVTNGTTPVNGPTAMTFSLYSSATPRNNPVWREQQPAVDVRNGIFSVQLGAVTPISVPFDVPYWLGVGVNNSGELQQPISSSAYAFRAGVADSVPSNSIGSTALTNNSITTAKIAAGAVTDSQISGPISANKLDLSTVVSKAGDTMTGDLSLSGANLKLSVTSAAAGSIMQGGSRLIHTYGTQSFFAGTNAGNLTNTGTSNTAIGTNALNAISNGIANTATGNGALASNAGGNWNTASGNGALNVNTSGNENTAIGGSTLGANITGNYNTATGAGALSSNTTGGSNTANGRYTLQLNTTANNNTALGNQALNRQSFTNAGNPWDSWNTAVGANALYFNQPSSINNGINNSGLGAQALYNNSTGFNNTASGYMALYANNTGSGNTANGYRALFGNTTGSNNTAIGSAADVTVNGLTNATAIGYNAKVGQSNSLVLGGTGADAVKVGIGTASPAATLDVVGDVNISGKLTAGTLASNSVTVASIADSAVTSSKIQDGSVTDSKISGTISMTKRPMTVTTFSSGSGTIFPLQFDYSFVGSTISVTTAYNQQFIGSAVAAGNPYPSAATYTYGLCYRTAGNQNPPNNWSANPLRSYMPTNGGQLATTGTIELPPGSWEIGFCIMGQYQFDQQSVTGWIMATN